MVKTILKSIALALAIAAIVLGIIGTASSATLTALLGIGLFALALATF